MTKSIRCKSQKEIVVNENLRIICLKTPGYRKNISIKRLWNHYIYAMKFGRKTKQNEIPPDVIIASCPPLISASVAIRVAKGFGTKCIIDIQDLWPETFEMVFPSKIARAFFYPLKKYANNIYSSADAVMGVSQTYVKRALVAYRDGKKSHVLYLGIDLKLFDKYRKNCITTEKRRDEFWATYIGTIGRSYDIKTILNVAEMLKHSHKYIKFFIAGDGFQLTEMKNIAEKKKLTNCKFLGFLKFEDMVGLLRQSDIGLHCIVARSKTSLPNKVFDYMAAELPIVNSVRGELEELLKSEKIGIQYEAGNPESLKDSILSLYNNPRLCKIMRENAKRVVKERFDKNKEYPKLEAFLRKVVEAGKQTILEDIGLGNVCYLKTHREAEEVARLHVNSIKEGFLSRLGEIFLNEFYRAISQSKYSFCLIAKHNQRIKGFIAGTTDISKFHKEFINKKGLKLIPLLLRNIFRRRIAIGILEDIFYPKRLSDHDGLPKAELIAIAVDENYQGKGYGLFLMNAFLKEMENRNIIDFKTFVSKSNIKAKQFYNKHGFVNKATINIHKGVESDILVKKLI